MGAVAIAGGTLVGVVTATSGVAFAAPPACTFNGSPTFVPGVLPGSVITLACTNLPAADSFAIAESSGLARVISPASDAQSVRDVAASKLGVTAATLQAGTTYTLPATYTATDPNAQCPMPQAQANLGVTNCTLEVDDVTTGNVPVGNALLGYTADATPANPTLTAAPGVGKAGDSVTVNGTGFWGAAISGAPGVLLGNPISAPAVTVGPNAVTPVSGNAVVPTVYNSNGTTGTFAANSATYGPAVLHVPAAVAGSNPVNVLEANTTPLTGNGSGGTVAGSAPFTVLGTPTLLASPSSNGPGNSTVVSGTGYDPALGANATLAFTTGTPASTGTATVDAAGNLTGTIMVTGNDTVGSNPIVASHGSETASAPFTVLAFVTQCSTPGPPLPCEINQKITQQVNGVGTGLSINETPAGLNVTMTPITLNGLQQTSTGRLNQVTLVDVRGTLVGWSLTAQFQQDNFTGPTAGTNPIEKQIPATNFFLGDGTTAPAPSVACLQPSQPPLGPPSCLISEQVIGAGNVPVPGPSGSAVSLSHAATGGGGGSFVVNSGVQMYVPSYIEAGSYEDTLSITVT